MEQVRIGSLPATAPLAIGTMQWGTSRIDHKLNRGTVADDVVSSIHRHASAHGVTLFDSAEGYGGGSSEERLRDAGIASASTMLTKFLPTTWRYTKHAFHKALDGSLQRLGLDCIPLYFVHSPTHPVALETWIEAAVEAVHMGKIKEIGLSNCNAEQVRRAQKVASAHGLRIAASQVMFNLLDYNSRALQEMKRVCDDSNITIIGYSPIGQGLLTDSLTPQRFGSIRAARMTGVVWEDLGPVRHEIKAIATRHGVSMAQVCLNWSMCKGVVPLIGCKTEKHITEAVKALDFRLEDDEVARLDRVALDRSTLEKPSWRRGIFVVLVSFLIFCYYVERLLLPRRVAPAADTKKDK